MFDQPLIPPVGGPTYVVPNLEPPTKSRVRSKLPVIILSIIGVLVIGGGVFAYFSYFRQTPEKVLGKMMENLSLAKAWEYSGEIKISYKVDDKMMQAYNLSALETALASSSKISQGTINFSGATTDYNTPGKAKSRFSINFRPDINQSKAMALGLEIISEDKLAYLRLTSLPELGTINLDFLKNQWVKISPDSLKSDLGLERTPATSSASSLIAERIAKLETLLKSSDIFQVSGQLPDENIDGLDSYHYQLSVNRDNLQKFLIAASEIASDKKMTAAKQAELQKAIAQADFSNLEIWVSKKEHIPTKLFLAIDIKEADGSASGKKMSLTLLFKNFNQPIDIQAPESFKTVQEIFSQFLNSLSSLNPSSKMPGLEMATSSPGLENSVVTTTPFINLDSDSDGLSDQEEGRWRTDKNNPDTDGDGYLDGAEVKANYNPKGPGKLPIPD